MIVVAVATFVVDQIVTIVVAIATTVVFCNDCDHCDNCDHIMVFLRVQIVVTVISINLATVNIAVRKSCCFHRMNLLVKSLV